MRNDVFDLHANLETNHWWFRAKREIIGRLLGALLPPAGRAAVIDVGCGTGANVAFLARDYRCLGIDPAERAIALARAAYPHLEFVCGEAPGDLPEWALRGDAFLLLDVLEHVADDAGFLFELVGAARPGALFLVTAPANPSLWARHDVALGHFRRYEPAGLRRLVAPLPVELNLLSYFNSRLYPVAWLVRRLEQVMGRSLGPSGTDLYLPPAPLNRFLYRVFRGEADRLLAVLRRGRLSWYSRGLSLLAILTKRGEGRAGPPSTRSGST